MRVGSSNEITPLSLSGTGNVGIGTTSPDHVLDIHRGNGSGQVVSIGAPQGSGRGLVFKDTHASPNKNNWLVGVQYNVNNALEITPSTAAGNLTFNNPAITVLPDGNVGIGVTAPQTTIDLNGALLTRVNTGAIGLGTYTVGNGMTQQAGGELEFMHMWSGTMHSGDTIVFTYSATSWKSWWFEGSAASTGGYGKTYVGGYHNNGMGNNYLETINTGMWSTTASNVGQNIIVTMTLNATWIHPLLKIKFGCGGGEGIPQLSRCSLVINS